MNKIIGIICSVIFFTSCTKRNMVDGPDDFDVTVERLTYKAGDTVKYNFSGNPENIVFWSGAEGNNYANRNRTEIEGNSLILDFKSFSQMGEVDQSSIKLLISNNFNGKYDPENVKAATWTDITNRAVWSSGADQTPSGNITLDEFTTGNKSIALAFRYITTVVKPITTQNRWVIRSFDLNSVSPAGKSNAVLSMGNAGWASFNYSGDSTSWTISATQLISMRNTTHLDDDWAVTKQVRPNAVSPDKGITLKNITRKITEYKTTYNEPGEYKVVFEATNARIKETKKHLKEFTITVEP